MTQKFNTLSSTEEGRRSRHRARVKYVFYLGKRSQPNTFVLTACTLYHGIIIIIIRYIGKNENKCTALCGRKKSNAWWWAAAYYRSRITSWLTFSSSSHFFFHSHFLATQHSLTDRPLIEERTTSSTISPVRRNRTFSHTSNDGCH